VAKKRSIKKTVVNVPQSLNEAADFLKKIGQLKRNLDSISAELTEKVSNLTSVSTTKAEPVQQELDELVEGLFAFAESNRDDLTEKGKKKTVELPTGIISWRITPPAVSLSSIDLVLDNLRKQGLTRFIRKKEEVDKEAMLREPELAETVKGVKIEQREEFVIKPSELTVEISSNAKKLRKTVGK
jgi:phage host-nuclease inhibitor protein Gam